MALLDNIVSVWELEEASGTRADATASANTLTDNNTVTQASGVVGNAAHFVIANGESLSHTDNNSLSTNTAASHTVDWTWVTWLKLTAKSTVQMPINKGSVGGDEYGLEYDNVGDNFLAFVNDGATSDIATVSASGISADTWCFIVMTLVGSSGALTVSLNAGTRATATVTHWPSDTSGLFSLGTYWPGLFYLGGDLDQVCFWKRAISTGEETLLYNGGSGMRYEAMLVSAGFSFGSMPHPTIRRSPSIVVI